MTTVLTTKILQSVGDFHSYPHCQFDIISCLRLDVSAHLCRPSASPPGELRRQPFDKLPFIRMIDSRILLDRKRFSLRVKVICLR